MNEPCDSVQNSLESKPRQSSDELIPLVYDELRRLAAALMAREIPGQTLSATALVHEAYFRISGDQDLAKWDGRYHFFSAAAIAMRRILVDSARRKKAIRRGGNVERVNVETSVLLAKENQELDMLDFDEALKAFELAYPIKARLVQLRCFAGLSNHEAAEVLEVTTRTAERYWKFSLAWLQLRLN